MKKDEYNVVKITNEDENLSFEFGLTQKNESTSYPDNEDKRRDDLNDAPTSNEVKHLDIIFY